ncbi:4-hydroxyphenylacetate permease [Raoultella planticola]|uniref:4-hydroxyphenylacetate permease n=1 Tax=Raoultella planticola TaxID=575 RepID=A0A485ASN8_RAOPL|nr:4-hydroxyphenylacetate permease [Raoultella planticola]
MWFWLDDSPDKAKWLTADDKACLKEMLDADRAALQQSRLSEASLPLSQRSMLRELFTPVIMLYTLAYFCLTNTLRRPQRLDAADSAQLQRAEQ